MTIKELCVTADTNDADYITRIEDITEEELEELMPLFDAINKFDAVNNQFKHSWPRSEYTRDESPEKNYPDIPKETIALFEECFCPYGEYGIHTIEEILVYPKPVKTKLV